MANKKFMWDTNMLKRFYEKYVINWLFREQNWTDEQKEQGQENLGIHQVLVSGSGVNSIVQKNTYSIADGDSSVSIGSCCSATSDSSFVLGNRLVSTNESETVFGNFNEPRENLIFSIGNGEDEETRKNIFEIEQLGDVYINYGGSLRSLQGIINALIDSIHSLGGDVTIPTSGIG